MAEEGYNVVLNVYDLSQGLARQLSASFLGKVIQGIWHTGVVVYGNEYYFGGGIQHSPSGTTPYGSPVQVVDLGVTYVPKDVFEAFLEEISSRYTAETYSILTHNCNNFSNEVAQFLVGASVPDYILNLPNEVLGSPMGALILPMIQNLETTLRAGAVPQVPQFKPPTPSQPVAVSKSSEGSNVNESDNDVKPIIAVESSKSEDSMQMESTGQPLEPVKTSANGTVDPLGDARIKVQEEICKEFEALMVSGTRSASEAGAIATRKVMQKYGYLNGSVPHS